MCNLLCHDQYIWDDILKVFKMHFKYNGIYAHAVKFWAIVKKKTVFVLKEGGITLKTDNWIDGTKMYSSEFLKIMNCFVCLENMFK